MAWLAVDKDYREFIYDIKPHRAYGDMWYDDVCDFVELPDGSIKKLTGKILTWEDEPIEI